MKKTCEKLKIPCGKFTEGGFILHDARHTFPSLLHHNLIDNSTGIEFTDNPTAIASYQHSSEESRRAMLVIEKNSETARAVKIRKRP